MQKFWDMVVSHFLSFTVVVLEVMIFQNKKSVVLEVGKNHKDCFDHGIELNGCWAFFKQVGKSLYGVEFRYISYNAKSPLCFYSPVPLKLNKGNFIK